MSGGSYNYAFRHVDDLSDQIAGRAGNSARRRMFADLLADAAVAAKAIEWCDSGDTGFPDDEVALVRFFTLARKLCEQEAEQHVSEIETLAALKVLHEKE